MTTPSAAQPPPGQEQEYPGRTTEMDPRPRDEMRDYQGRGLLAGTSALITGDIRGPRPAVVCVHGGMEAGRHKRAAAAAELERTQGVKS